ncbi:MAG: hypothetical protein IJX87_04975 [Clostridia bacterium]|nr:hypothetical protein [Clostridia bacterium]
MRYTAQSSKYIWKNFFFVLPFAIIPAFFLSVSTDEKALIDVLTNCFTGKIQETTYSQIFRAISVLNFGSWQSVVFGIVGIVLIVVCVALLMAFLEKHMRIGKRTYTGLLGKLNDNFLSTCSYALIMIVGYELWCLFTAAFLFLVSRISVDAVAYVLTVGFLLLMHALLIYAIGHVYLWLPCMQITGFRALEALHYSYQLMDPVKWPILLGQLFFLLFTETLICLSALFAPAPVIFTVLTTVLYTALILIYCVRMQITYFDRDNIQRADLPGYYYGR